jgi:hypothetical protein
MSNAERGNNDKIGRKKNAVLFSFSTLPNYTLSMTAWRHLYFSCDVVENSNYKNCSGCIRRSTVPVYSTTERHVSEYKILCRFTVHPAAALLNKHNIAVTKSHVGVRNLLVRGISAKVWRRYRVHYGDKYTKNLTSCSARSPTPDFCDLLKSPLSQTCC